MTQVNQYEDFESFSHVAYVLGEFIVVNAAFSFATDVCAQKLEGNWFCCKPSPPEVAPPEQKADEGKGAEGQVPDKAGEEGQVEGGQVPVEVVQVQWEEPEPWDVSRSCRFAVTGVFFCGVVQFIRLSVIDVVFDRSDKSLKAAVWKTVMNQAVFSPIVRAWSMMTVRYFYKRSKGLSPAKSWNSACRNLRDKFCEAQSISYLVKPLSNFIAFAFFPNHILAQAIVMRSVAFVYNVYFDFVVHGDEKAKKAKKKKLLAKMAAEAAKEGKEPEKVEEVDSDTEDDGCCCELPTGEEGEGDKDKQQARTSGCCCQSCSIM